MRILHVEKFVARNRGGASTYMFDLMHRQRLAGHDVEVFGMTHPDNEPSRFGDQFAPRVELSPLPSGVMARARIAGRMVWSRSAAKALDVVLDEFQPDVVHCHNLYHQLSPSVLRPVSRRRIPAVMTVHDFKLVCPTYHLMDGAGDFCTACVDGSALNVVRRQCEQNSRVASGVLALEAVVHRRLDSYAPIDRFLCPSRFLLNQLHRGGISEGRLEHLPNAIELPAGENGTEQPQRADGPLRLVFTGQLIERKGVDLVIEAIEPLRYVELTVCGDGPQRSSLEDQARPLGARVRFAGHLDSEQLAAELDRADGLVLASRGMENQPLSVVEAFAHGTPAVVSDTEPMRELVIEGETGHLFAQGSIVELRAAIERLGAKREHRTAMGRNARHLAAEHHDIDRHLQRIEAIYEEVQL